MMNRIDASENGVGSVCVWVPFYLPSICFAFPTDSLLRRISINNIRVNSNKHIQLLKQSHGKETFRLLASKFPPKRDSFELCSKLYQNVHSFVFENNGTFIDHDQTTRT